MDMKRSICIQTSLPLSAPPPPPSSNEVVNLLCSGSKSNFGLKIPVTSSPKKGPRVLLPVLPLSNILNKCCKQIRKPKFFLVSVICIGSRVDTPRDGDLWTLAKLNLQVTDMTYSQVVDHLVKVHLLLEPLCVVLQRRLSKVHPLHQLLKFHCRGITVTNNLGVPNLVGPGRSTDQLNAFGAKGSNELLLGAYAKFGWEQTDFEGNLKVHYESVKDCRLLASRFSLRVKQIQLFYFLFSKIMKQLRNVHQINTCVASISSRPSRLTSVFIFFICLII